MRSGPGDAAVDHPDPGTAASAPVTNASWKVVDGLAGEGCHSLESVDHPGHYLRPVGFRVRLLPSDGGAEFKNAATWCARKGLAGSGVSLEARSQPGRFLRHLGTELWVADNSGAHAFDRACAYQANATWQVDGPDPRATKRPDPVRAECLAECARAVSAYVVRNDGQLRLYQHADPLRGGFSWVDGAGSQIGQGWLGARTVAGPDGVVYAAVDNGELRRLRWNGTDWDVTNGAQYQVIDTGWARYATAPYRNRITVDTRGDIYTVEPDGRLHWRSYRAAGAGSWEHRTLDGDYRYLPATETWADTGRGTGKVVGTGWHGEYNLTAAPDGCRLS